MKRHLVLIVLVLTLAVCGESAVEGSPITYYFSGTVGTAFGALDPLTNSTFTGQLIYDPAWLSSTGGYRLPPGAFSLTTASGSSVTGSGFVVPFSWSISTSLGLEFAAVFDGPSALGAASIMLRGPAGSDAGGPVLPPDLSGWLWDYRPLYLSSGNTPGLMEAESMVDCVTTNAGGCGAAPVPEPASLLLVGTGLVGLRAWRKRRT